MFGRSNADLARWLAAAERHCIERSRFNQAEALQQLAATIGNDRRFDDYDATKLARRVVDSRQHGRVLDLTDPELQENGEPRPHAHAYYPGCA
jgi:hypothetical protein